MFGFKNNKDEEPVEVSVSYEKEIKKLKCKNVIIIGIDHDDNSKVSLMNYGTTNFFDVYGLVEKIIPELLEQIRDEKYLTAKKLFDAMGSRAEVISTNDIAEKLKNKKKEFDKEFFGSGE